MAEARSTSTSTSLKDYLKRYESADQGQQKKKKKKKTAKNSAPGGVLIVDEDPVWGKTVISEAEEEPEAEETPVVDEDVEVKRMRRLELLRSRKPYHSLSEDGSGWVSIANPSTRTRSPSREISPDLSPPRRRNSSANGEDLSPPRRKNSSPTDEDLSPPRRRKASPSGEPNLSPPRRRRHSSPQNEDLSPPRRRKNVASEDLSSPGRKPSTRSEDLSPPRRRKNVPAEDLSPPRRKSSALSKDLSLPGRSKHVASEDLSPPRRRYSAQGDDLSSPRRKDVPPEDLSPPRRKPSTLSEDLFSPRRRKNVASEDFSPRRKVSTQGDDISPPRKRKNRTPVHSPRRERKSGQRELSPRREKRTSQEDISLSRPVSSPPGESKKKQPIMKEERRAGLFTGREIKEEIDRKKEEEASRFNALDPSMSGRGAEPVYRNKEGKRISKEEMMKAQKVEEKPKEKKIEWGKGLVQKREAETKIMELELEKEKPFARSKDDPELDKMLRERTRWGDPMAHLIKKKQPLDTVLEDLGEDDKMKESGFIIPQGIPIHSWLKRGVDPPANRYGIRPGRHWDGVDRSNGFEKQMFQRQNERRATQTEAYLWSVSDM